MPHDDTKEYQKRQLKRATGEFYVRKPVDKSGDCPVERSDEWRAKRTRKRKISTKSRIHNKRNGK